MQAAFPYPSKLSNILDNRLLLNYFICTAVAIWQDSLAGPLILVSRISLKQLTLKGPNSFRNRNSTDRRRTSNLLVTLLHGSTSSIPADVQWCFGRKFCLRLQGRIQTLWRYQHIVLVAPEYHQLLPDYIPLPAAECQYAFWRLWFGISACVTSKTNNVYFFNFGFRRRIWQLHILRVQDSPQFIGMERKCVKCEFYIKVK
jgi:hypothetical protein